MRGPLGRGSEPVCRGRSCSLTMRWLLSAAAVLFLSMKGGSIKGLPPASNQTGLLSHVSDEEAPLSHALDAAEAP